MSPAKDIGRLFRAATGHDIVFSFGSSGQLFAQIAQDAPFDVFLAADQAIPSKAIEDGFAVRGSRFTYATGKIILFSRDPALVRGASTLHNATFSKIAIANPKTAPYGTAAIETMRALGVYEALKSKLVRGNNVAQAYQFVETENAEVGFVSLSQVITNETGSRWIVPDDLYSEIAQDAVLLKRGATSDAARAFFDFLKGSEARAVMERYGYGPAD